MINTSLLQWKVCVHAPRQGNTLAQPYRNTHKILNTVKYRQILGIANRTRFYYNTVKYPRQLLATIWERIRYRWIPLATLNTQIIFFLNVCSDGHEADKTSGASIVFIRTNSAKIQIYRQLLLATQIPKYLGCQHQILCLSVLSCMFPVCFVFVSTQLRRSW